MQQAQSIALFSAARCQHNWSSSLNQGRPFAPFPAPCRSASDVAPQRRSVGQPHTRDVTEYGRSNRKGRSPSPFCCARHPQSQRYRGPAFRVQPLRIPIAGARIKPRLAICWRSGELLPLSTFYQLAPSPPNESNCFATSLTPFSPGFPATQRLQLYPLCHSRTRQRISSGHRLTYFFLCWWEGSFCKPFWTSGTLTQDDISQPRGAIRELCPQVLFSSSVLCY